MSGSPVFMAFTEAESGLIGWRLRPHDCLKDDDNHGLMMGAGGGLI